MAILKQQNPKIQYLTDDVILAYTGDNVLYDYRDINQKTPLNIGYTGGVYDPKIFGSIFANQCNCGEVRGTGIVCTKCGTMALPKEEKYSRFARIDLKYYYCNNLRMAELVKYLRANYKFKILASSDNSVVAKSNIAAGSLDTCQFEADKDSGKIVVTDEITDFSKVSFEGLLKAIEDLGGNTTIVKRFLNKSILVVPAALRPVRLSIDTTEDGKKLLEIHDISLVYKSIIYINNVLIPELMEDKEYSLKAKALQLGCYRKYFSQALVAMSGLLKPSKESFARQLQAARLGDSGRCTIVPKPELKANEVMIPRHMMYEVCKQEFVQWLQRKNGWDEIKALNQYEEHPLDKQTQDWFDEYINGDPNDPNDRKMVIICRNPTLHKLNLLACKVILTNEMCMGISLPTCEPVGGDFDGDTMSFYSIPKHLNAQVNDTMNPKQLIYYTKNHETIFMPSHERCHGLFIGTRVRLPENGVIMNFNSVEEAKEYKKTHRDLKYQTQITIKGKKTTLGRQLFGQLFDKDLDAYIGDKPGLTPKMLKPLYQNLAPDYNPNITKEGRLERIQKIDELAILISTLSGQTAPTIEDLYLDIDESYLKEMRAVMNDDELTDREKSVKTRLIFEKFEKEEEKKVNPGLRTSIEDSGRAKISQLMQMMMPRMNIGPGGYTNVANSRIIDGMTAHDYEQHCIENRALQDLKHSGVPMSGSMTRQFVFLATKYEYEANSQDLKNPGILMKKCDAIGRTMVNGEIIANNDANMKDESIVRVRSMVTRTYPEACIYGDLVPNILDKAVTAHLAMNMMSSLTEGVTQAVMGLKHGGFLVHLDKKGYLTAREDCTVEDDGVFLTMKYDNGGEYKIPKPVNFVFNVNGDKRYKAGETIGINYEVQTPTFAIDTMCKVTEARKVTPDKSFARNKVEAVECYCYETGIIHYERISPGTNALRVTIGNKQYSFSKNSLYLFPEGAEVKEGQRICTGVLNVKALLENVNDRERAWYIYKSQCDEIKPGISSDLWELLFDILIKQNGDHMEQQKVISTVQNGSSLYTALSFENAKKVLQSTTVSGREFEADPFTRLLLPLLFDGNTKKLE